MKEFKYLSLFSGIGGFELGIEKSEVKWKYSGHAEIKPIAKKVYKQHFPLHNNNYEDIKKVVIENTNKIEDFDIMLGGFPCQPYSSLSLQNADKHEKGDLFRIIKEILIKKQPKCFFLENVKGLVTMRSGIVFKNIILHLKEAGYNVFYKVLNSKDFGVAQLRSRVYIVGFRNDLNIHDFKFPEGKNDEELDFRDFLEENPPEDVYFSPLELLKLKSYGKKTCIDKLISFSKIHNCIFASYRKSSSDAMRFERNERVSILTPLEAERLQGFPDNFTEILSVNQRYDVIGNSVTPNVISEISKMIDKALRSL